MNQNASLMSLDDSIEKKSSDLRKGTDRANKPSRTDAEVRNSSNVGFFSGAAI